MKNDNTITYVYRGTEVVLTGRKASRQLTHNPTRRNAKSTPDEEILHEIIPADPKNGSWSSWVKKDELFVIISAKPEEEGDESL